MVNRIDSVTNGMVVPYSIVASVPPAGRRMGTPTAAPSFASCLRQSKSVCLRRIQFHQTKDGGPGAAIIIRLYCAEQLNQ